MNKCFLFQLQSHQNPHNHHVKLQEAEDSSDPGQVPRANIFRNPPLLSSLPWRDHLSVSDLRKFHAACCEGWTNDWYEGTPPMLGCQGIYSMPPDKYFEAINSFELIAGDWGRGLGAPSARCILTLDGPPPTTLRVPALRRSPGQHRPLGRDALGAPTRFGPGIIRAPPCSYNPGYHAMHGICGPVDLDKLEDPSYLSKLWALYQGTFHYEHGAGLEDHCDGEHEEVEHGAVSEPPES